MRTLLLPVKDFTQAKQRLTGTLEPAQRAGLARAMLSDVLSAIVRARMPQRVIVFTASEAVAEVVRPFPFEIVHEDDVQGHSAAVNRMVDQLADSGAQVLSLAGDLPTLAPKDIDVVFDSRAQISLVASRDRTGTNAALFRLPARIQMSYGEGSLQRHLASAAGAEFKTEVLRIPGIEFDLDTAEDLEFFLQTPETDSDTWAFVRSECADRFK